MECLNAVYYATVMYSTSLPPSFFHASALKTKQKDRFVCIDCAL